MTFCTLGAPGEVAGGIRMCGYEAGHPPPCKMEKPCKSCGKAMHPDQPLDDCLSCDPDLHLIFAQELAKRQQGAKVADPTADEQQIQSLEEPKKSEYDILLEGWFAICEQIKPLREELKPMIELEQQIRRKLTEVAFTPQNGEIMEGAKYRPIANGWQLKADLKVERKVLPDALPAIFEQLKQMKVVDPTTLIRNVPTVNVKVMRELTAEQLRIFEVALVIKPQMPTLELVPPKAVK